MNVPACHSHNLLMKKNEAMYSTCSEVLRRCESQVRTVALAISTILHEAKAREPRISIL